MSASLLSQRRLAAGTLAALLAAAAPAAAETRIDASRIVAAGGAVTETLYALGLADRVVGVDATSLHPPEALKDKPNVGYVRQLSAEGLLSLRPTIVIAIPNAGPPDVLRLIREAGVPHLETPDDASADGVVAKILRIGEIAGAPDKAARLAEEVKRKFAELDALRAGVAKPKRVLFVLALREGRPLVGGRNSGADAIIRLAGATNAADSVEGYKPMTDEAVIAAQPDVILMMDRGQHAVKPEELFRHTAFALTPAAANRALVLMDGLYLLGFGPRAPDAAKDLMLALYPDLRNGRRADATP